MSATTNFASPARSRVFVREATIIIWPEPSTSTDAYTGITGPTSLGSGGFTPASSDSGDRVGIDDGTALLVPAGYLSGHSLSDTSTYDNATFASLGVTPGTYKWTWGDGRACGQLHARRRHPRTLDMGADGARLRWPRLRWVEVASSERLRRRLKALPSREQENSYFSEALAAEGAVVFAKACELGFERIVSKREGSLYKRGKSRNWLKTINPSFVRT